MAIKGPKRPGEVPPRPVDDPKPEPKKDLSLPATRWPQAVRQPAPVETRDREREQEAEKELLGEGRLGDPSVTPDELMAMGSLVRARHIMTLLARRRGQIERDAIIREAGDLLLALDPAEAKRLLFTIAEAGRIVDVYPLELLFYVHERRAVAGVEVGSVVLNKAGLERDRFHTDQVLLLKLPLAMRLRAFAIEGGARPGYALAPGPPGAYHLQFDEAGEFPLLVQGMLRRRTLLDRLVVRIH